MAVLRLDWDGERRGLGRKLSADREFERRLKDSFGVPIRIERKILVEFVGADNRLGDIPIETGAEPVELSRHAGRAEKTSQFGGLDFKECVRSRIVLVALVKAHPPTAEPNAA